MSGRVTTRFRSVAGASTASVAVALFVAAALAFQPQPLTARSSMAPAEAAHIDAARTPVRLSAATTAGAPRQAQGVCQAEAARADRAYEEYWHSEAQYDAYRPGQFTRLATLPLTPATLAAYPTPKLMRDAAAEQARTAESYRHLYDGSPDNPNRWLALYNAAAGEYGSCRLLAEATRLEGEAARATPAPRPAPSPVPPSTVTPPRVPPATVAAGTPQVSAAELTKNLSAGYAALQQRTAAQAATGQRKTHNLTLEASSCVSRLENDVLMLYGGLRNSCAFEVNVAFCTVGSKPGSWSAEFECGSGGGLVSIAANNWTTLHTKDAQSVQWAACQVPASPMDQEWKPGQTGIAHRCR
jgi:hypothetical protein